MDNYELVPMPGLEIIREDYKNNLQYLRNKKRLTQAKLAELSGVNLRMIQKYENGERDINGASALTVYKIAKALDCSVGDLLNF